MSATMHIQFNGKLADEAHLLAELRARGIDALSVRASRWIRTHPASGEESDAGGRIDVEIQHRPMPEARPVIEAVERLIDDSPLVTS
jgi:hypothetical protein